MGVEKGRFLFDKDQGPPPSNPTDSHQDALPEESPPTLTVELQQVPDADAEFRIRKAYALVLKAALPDQPDKLTPELANGLNPQATEEVHNA